MNLVLNIGLARTGNSNIGVGTVLRELEARGLHVAHYAIHHSETEITVVADINPSKAAYYAPVYQLAEALGQDCIAVYCDGAGRLIGPNTAAWGEFNPEFFLCLDGATLAAPQPAGYIALTADDVDLVKADAVEKHAALWLHNFPQMLEAVILQKNAHLLNKVSPTL
jgi:hypothetical protein